MFTHRTARFGLAKVFGLVHIYLACVSLHSTDAGLHSVELADDSGSSRKLPSLSFRIMEGNSQDEPPDEGRSFSHPKSHQQAVKKDENHVPQRGMVSSLRHVHQNRTGIRDSQSRDNTNVNLNNAATVDKVLLSDSEDSDDLVVYSSVVKIEAKLYGSYKFGVNIIKVFGQILKAPNNRLTVDQFTSLNLILKALVDKQVYTFDLLTVLKKLQGVDKETQFKLVLQALADNVPMYIVSACTFWLKEIEHGHVNINELTSSLEQPHNFLAGIDRKVIDICAVKVTNEEMEPFDEPSELIKKTLGLVFVKIFNKLKNYDLILTQKLFGAILVNLPIGKSNPILEEYINYIWEIVQDNLLPNWDKIAPKIKYATPYQLVKSVAIMLLTEGNLSEVPKHAFEYLVIHLKEVPSTFTDENYSDMQILLNNEKTVELLFSMILDDPYISESCELRDQILTYVKQINMDEILQGMNMFAYQTPIDLLIALLVRIESRTRDEDIRNTATKLLSIIISKKEFESFTVTLSSDVDFVMLLGFLNVPDHDPAISNLAQKIKLYLERDIDLLVNLQNLIPIEDKSKCQRPIQCLLYVLTKAVNPDSIEKLGVPPKLLEMLQTLIDLINKAIDSSMECKPLNIIPVKRPEVPDDTSDVTSSPVPLPTSIMHDEIVSEPDLPDSHSYEDWQIVFPTLPDTKEIFPDKEVTGPILIVLPNHPEPLPTVKPTPELKTTSTIYTTSNVPPTLSSERPVLTTKQPSDVAPEIDPVLPPNFSYDQPLYIVISKDDLPPYTSLTKPTNETDLKFYFKFPSIKELLQELDSKVLFDPSKRPELQDVIEPLKKLLGPNLIEELLGKYVDKTKYPTVISLMDDMLDHALENPKVKVDLKLVSHIKLYLKAIEYLAITALFPVVVDCQKINSDVIHVTFDPHNLTANSIDTVPPERIPAGFLTLTLYHPKYWVKNVNSLNPYLPLLPALNDGEDNPIQKLIKEGSLENILGANFDPLLYPNQGTLLVVVLQKLIVSKRVQSDLSLLTTLKTYLTSIKAVAFYNKIPKDYGIHILEVQLSNQVNWHPDLSNLMSALPLPTNQHELKKIQLIQKFLQTPNLLKMLNINSPPYFVTRGEFLKIIFETAIRGGKKILDLQTLAALEFYKSKILMHGDGALPIIWVWVQMFIIREEVPLGEIIEAVIDYDSLPYELRLSYNNLMTYLSENPEFLQGDDSFPFEKYSTKGTFLAGLFAHFLTNPDMSQEVKEYIKELIPHIKLTGPGAESMKHVTIDDLDLENGNINKHEVSVIVNG